MADSLRASKQGLEKVDQARRLKGWAATATAWCQAAQTSAATIKRFRRGIAIQQASFVAICKAVGIQNWEDIVDRNTQSSSKATGNFFAYDDDWVGREPLIADLRQKLEGHNRVLILTGIAGIGKTALAERLTIELQEEWLKGNWSNFIQENFDDQEQAAGLVSVVARLLEKCGQMVIPDDRKDPQGLLYRLVKHLQENRYLLVMDSLEKILQGNEEEGWSGFQDEGFVQFFRAIFSAESFQSRIILTSQDIPAQILETGTRYQNFWYCQPLSGLSGKEQLALFEKTGLDTQSDSLGKSYLVRIGKAYEGHPLALRVIAGEIGSHPFYGNVTAYWNKYGKEVEEVEKAIVEAQAGKTTGEDEWKLDRFTRTLRSNVRKRLQQTFERLRTDIEYAYILLCETSVYRLPVQEDFWLSHLEDWDCNENQQLIALEALKDRYLVEEVVNHNQYFLRQHNLVRSLSLEHLKALDGLINISNK